jgi:hypothetical protein
MGKCSRWIFPEHAQPGLSVQEVVDKDVGRYESMLTIEGTCGLDRRSKHSVQAYDGRIDFFDDFGDLAKVCKVIFLLPGCNEDLHILCKCLDTFDAMR